MPLLDHFQGPVIKVISWSTLHSGWATRLADDLNERWLPKEYIAGENSTSGMHPEIDIAAYEQPSVTSAPLSGYGAAVGTLTRPVWQVTKPTASFAATFPESFEVKIHTDDAFRKLIAVVELVSPSNKDRPSERRAFVAKTAAYLERGVSVVIVDIVTNKRFNLHNELIDLLAAPRAALMHAAEQIYTASYRPTIRNENPQVDLWSEPLTVGQPLPTMPLRLTGDLFVPIELETTYMETCRRRRLL